MNLDINSIKSFHFVSYSFDYLSNTAEFCYSFDNGPLFVEHLTFNGVNHKLDIDKKQALDHFLKHLYLVLGISYYKAAIPNEIVIDNLDIAEDTAAFLEKLYINGLGEFAYRNNIDLRDRIRFPYSLTAYNSPVSLRLPRRTAVPIGGGKDSIVTLEILKSAKEPIVLYSLGNFKVMQDVAKQAKVPCITVTRTLSPLLFKINSQGALNGHVPISAIIAFTLPVAAILYGFDVAALSNERSASIGNLIHKGVDINHQYSKGYDFEQDVSNYFKKYLSPNFNYFSFLRPLSEIGIAKLFVEYKSYHSIFTSCNSVYRIHERSRNRRWCLNCPKCRFTFLSLAPFMSKNDLLNIFGSNILNDRSQLSGFDELTGMSGNKPFECVGEEEESVAAFALIANRPEWKNDYIVKQFAEEVLINIKNSDKLITKALDFSEKHSLPSPYEELLRAHIKKAMLSQY